MPIIKPDSDLLGGWDVKRFRFASALPDASFLAAAGNVGGYFGGFKDSLFAAWQLENALNGVQQLAALDAWKIGVPSVMTDALGELFALAPELAYTDARSKAVDAVIRGAALTGVAKSIQLVMTEIVADIPIVGWVVEIGLAVYRFVRGFVDLWKTSPPPPQANAVLYAKDSDEIIAQAMLDAFASDDWTILFLPQSTGDWTTLRLAYTSSGLTDGLAFGPSVGSVDLERLKDAFAVVPGVAELADYWQFPFKARGGSSGRDSEPPATGLSTLLPSVLQLGSIAWQRVQSYGVRMFSVDAWKVRSRWRDFWSGGWELFDRSDDEALRFYLAYHCACGWLDAYGGVPALAPKSGLRGKVANRFEHIDVERVFEATGGTTPTSTHGQPVSMGDLVEYEIGRWAERADACLETLYCAYVAPHAPGLRPYGAGESPLARKHFEMRRELLRHPARFDVELDLIPDTEYRSLMAQATMFQGGGAQWGNAPGGPTTPLRFVLFDGVLEPPRAPSRPGIDRSPSRAGGGSSGGGGSEVFVGLGAALGVLLWLKARG